MKIISFDSAMENMGVCVINFDETWTDKAETETKALLALYKRIPTLTKKEFLTHAAEIVKRVDAIFENTIRLDYVNVFDLVPKKGAKEEGEVERSRRLAFLLTCIDKQFGRPDTVLIEYQMGLNDTTRIISNQIAYHYTMQNAIATSYSNELRTEKRSVIMKNKAQYDIADNAITYSVPAYPLNDLTTVTSEGKNNNKAEEKNKEILIEFIGPTLKNVYHLAPKGEYYRFIEKYSNQTANKKHTEYNFSHYMNVMGKADAIANVKNKLADMADAFMQVYGWLKKKQYI